MTIKIKKKIVHSSPQHAEILMKLSELTAAVAVLETKVDAVATKLDAFLAIAGDPPVPVEAEAAIGRTSDKLVALEARIPPAA